MESVDISAIYASAEDVPDEKNLRQDVMDHLEDACSNEEYYNWIHRYSNSPYDHEAYALLTMQIIENGQFCRDGYTFRLDTYHQFVEPGLEIIIRQARTDQLALKKRREAERIKEMEAPEQRMLPANPTPEQLVRVVDTHTQQIKELQVQFAHFIHEYIPLDRAPGDSDDSLCCYIIPHPLKKMEDIEREMRAASKHSNTMAEYVFFAVKNKYIDLQGDNGRQVYDKLKAHFHFKWAYKTWMSYYSLLF